MNLYSYILTMKPYFQKQFQVLFLTCLFGLRFNNALIVGANRIEVLDKTPSNRELPDTTISLAQIFEVNLTSNFTDIKVFKLQAGKEPYMRIKAGTIKRSGKVQVANVEIIKNDQAITVQIGQDNKNNNIVFGHKNILSSELQLYIDSAALFNIQMYFGSLNINTCKIGKASIVAQNGNISIMDIQGDLNLNHKFGETKLRGIKGNCNMKLHNSNYEITTVLGDMNLQTSFGTGRLEKIVGDLNLATGNGNVTGIDLAGNTINWSHRFGNIILDKVVSQKFTLSQQNGNSSIANCKARLTYSSKFGNVTILEFDGILDGNIQNGNLTASKLNGSLNLVTKFGRTNLRAFSGNLILIGENGNLNIEESDLNISASLKFGSVSLDKVMVRNNCKISTTNGSISANIQNPQDKLNATCKTSNGVISVNDRITTTKKASDEVIYGTGNIAIQLYTNFGNINLE